METEFNSEEIFFAKVISLIKNKKYNEAKKLISTQTINPKNNERYFFYLGSINKNLNLLDEALDNFKNVLIENKSNVASYINIAGILDQQKKYVDEIKYLTYAYELKPTDDKIIYLLARAQRKNKNYELAIKSFEKIKSQFKETSVLLNLAECNKFLFEKDKAIHFYEKYIQKEKKNIKVYLSLGYLYSDKKKYTDALRAFGQAEKLSPADFRSYLGVSKIVNDKKKVIELLSTAYKLSGNDPSIYLEKILAQSKICDWSFWDNKLTNLKKLFSLTTNISPFSVFFLDDDCEIHQKIAQSNWEKVKKSIQPLTTQYNHKNQKIRIGYISQNFGVHAMMFLAPALFRYFDREKFEVFSYSLMYENNKSPQQDLVKEFSTKFFNVENFDSHKIAKLIFSHKIDILVDLSGYQKNCRPEVFAYKPAPLIINYLRNPGTMGSDVHDYFICDTNALPEQNRKYFSEKIISLPHTYFPYDDQVVVSNKNISKTHFDIPRDKVVLGCFNNIYKITPVEFNIWMKILSDNKKTVMVFKTGDMYAIENLKKEALRQNVAVNRLFFLKKMPHSEHLLSYTLIDIFLDTFNYNAHTTAIEALYMNVPVITKTGNHVASRAATGILMAIGLEELICASEKEYEETIVKFILNTDKLTMLKKKLTRNKQTHNLFNSKLYVKNLEHAYKIIHEKYQANSATTDIYVE